MTEPAGLLWAQACDTVRARVGDKNFATWIAPLRCTWRDGTVALEAPDRRTCDLVGRHFVGVIEEAVAAAAGHACAVRLDLPAEPPPEPVALPVRAVAPSPAHTFDTFVVGESNGRAHSATHAVATGIATTPILIHGPAGVGKTHLLHAAYHAVAARGVRVACLPAAELMEGLVGAVRAEGADGFWHDLRQLGGLLLDDVHSLAGREQVQERLLDELVAWVEEGRILVLTSDRAPDDMAALLARIRDRLRSALIAAIAPPEPALRLRIVHSKARALGMTLDAGLAARIASDVGGNVRRLEGALRRLLAHARLGGRGVDEALAREVLPALGLRPRVPPTIDAIVDETAFGFGIATRALRGRSRRPDLLLPRQVAMYLCRKLLRRSFADLGTAFGRDHTTVLHACRTIDARIGTDRKLGALVERIERRLAAHGGG